MFLFRKNLVIKSILILGLCGVQMQLFAGSSPSPAASPLGREIQASDTLWLGLQDAVFMGLKNNPTVTIQKLAPEIANTYAREERAPFDPVFSATAQQSDIHSERRLGAQRTPFNLEDKQFDVGAQITQALPTGTLISVGMGMGGSVSNLYTDQYTSDVGVTITQSLLSGFGFGANLASLRKARLDVDISKLELKAVAEKLDADIEKGYWELYLTGRETEIQNQSLQLAQQQLSESLERVAVGKLPRLELAAVEAEVAARRGSLIDAQSRHEQSRLHLLYLLNPEKEEFWTTLTLPQDQPFVPADTLDSIAVHEAVGMKFRPDLKQARLALRKGELELARTRNGLLPQLDLFITLGRTTYSESFRNSFPDLSSPFYQVTGGLTFVFPVPNRQASAQLARTRYSLEQQQLAVKNMEKLVQWDIRSAYVEVIRSRQQIEATRVTRELQEKKLAAEQEKFRVGKSTNFLVLQAQRDLTASRLDEANAMVAYLNALVDLYVSEGTLLERRGVRTFSD